MTSLLRTLPLLVLSGCQLLVGINDLQESNQGPDAGNTAWTVRRANPIIHDVIYANGQFVEVGGLGLIETSPDGITWMQRTSNSTAELSGIIFANGKYFAPAGDGTIITSPDGVTWTRKPNTPGYGIYTMAFGNGKYVGNDGGSFFTSTDGQTGWLETQSQGDVYHTYFINGLFIATLYNGGFVTSTDGVTWTPRTFVTGDQPKGVAYDATNTRWVATGETHTAISSDGLSWTSPTSVDCCFEAAVFSGTNFFTVGRQGHMAYGTNGTSWTTATIPGEDYYGLAFGAGNFVAAGQTRAHSSNGTTWTLTRAEPSSAFRAVATSDGALGGAPLFVATGDYGKIFTSADGATWTRQPQPAGTCALNLVGFGGGKYVVLCAGSQTFYSSPDGVTWTMHMDPTNGPGNLTYGNGTWVISDGANFLWSTDLDNWNFVTSSHPTNCMGPSLFANATFVLMGQCDGTVYTSPDGKTWQRALVPGANGFNFLVYGNGKLVAINNSLAVQTSADARTWTQPYQIDGRSGRPAGAVALGFDGTHFVIDDFNNNFWYSTDGQTWSTTTDLSKTKIGRLHAFAYSPNLHRAVGVGEWESIVTLP